MMDNVTDILLKKKSWHEEEGYVVRHWRNLLFDKRGGSYRSFNLWPTEEAAHIVMRKALQDLADAGFLGFDSIDGKLPKEEYAYYIPVPEIV